MWLEKLLRTDLSTSLPSSSGPSLGPSSHYGIAFSFCVGEFDGSTCFAGGKASGDEDSGGEGAFLYLPCSLDTVLAIVFIVRHVQRPS